MLTSFEKIMQSIINVKAKIGLKSSTIIWDLDI